MRYGFHGNGFFTVADISEALGISGHAVRSALRKRGLKKKHGIYLLTSTELNTAFEFQINRAAKFERFVFKQKTWFDLPMNWGVNLETYADIARVLGVSKSWLVSHYKPTDIEHSSGGKTTYHLDTQFLRNDLLNREF